MSFVLKRATKRVYGIKGVRYSAEVSALCCLTRLVHTFVCHTITLHFNTIVQPRIMEYYHCCCDLLTMKSDHYSSLVSVQYRALASARML